MKFHSPSTSSDVTGGYLSESNSISEIDPEEDDDDDDFIELVGILFSISINPVIEGDDKDVEDGGE